ncbi:MAG: beta-fructofuranosidase, partial [Candidatus Hydrogenedentes bacterium]|nr:beta-fructofuranosidase [Candidatus Hydrogenedentota bacterium]
ETVSPFDDAVAVWHMADETDSAGANSPLTIQGVAKAGVALTGNEREASLRRGGDGYTASIEGGYLSAGQGAGNELNLTGQTMSLCLRFSMPADVQDTPLFSKHGGHEALVYNLFCTTLNGRVSIGFELGTDCRTQPLQVSVPVDRIGANAWHDVIVRFTGPRLELFVDGVLVDEEWPIGSLRIGNTYPCLIGAEAHGNGVKQGFRGLIDHAALWNRALSDDEIVFLSGGPETVTRRDIEILGKPDTRMQYWRPRGHNASVGDCMPFYHDGRFHLFYLFDRRHHGSKWGLGAHQWAHASTTDLVHWEHHPMAIPITEPWEGSICTGSVFFHDGTYYAHYATRMPDMKQHLARALSTDGIHFTKTGPNPLASPEEGYDPDHYRDPMVFQDNQTGLFHMLVTARLTDGRDGCLAHLVSEDLNQWKLLDPFIVPGRVTDCPDYFEWNGWYYLMAEFVYWTAREPFGPWTQPESNRLDVLYVPKTAPFGDNRRIYVSWLPNYGWGGNAVFRELIQREDGTLGTKFPPEMVPPSGEPLALSFDALTEGVTNGDRTVLLDAADGAAVVALTNVPRDIRITFELTQEPGPALFGVGIRGTSASNRGCELWIDPPNRHVQLGGPDCVLDLVRGLDGPFTLDIVVEKDIVDVCIGNQRTIISRYPGKGDRFSFFVEKGAVTFSSIEARALTE